MSSGIAIPVPQRYEKMTLVNIFNLRNTFQFQDPIEIWEVGEELSLEARNLLSSFSNLTGLSAFAKPIKHA